MNPEKEAVQEEDAPMTPPRPHILSDLSPALAMDEVPKSTSPEPSPRRNSLSLDEKQQQQQRHRLLRAISEDAVLSEDEEDTAKDSDFALALSQQQEEEEVKKDYMNADEQLAMSLSLQDEQQQQPPPPPPRQQPLVPPPEKRTDYAAAPLSLFNRLMERFYSSPPAPPPPLSTARRVMRRNQMLDMMTVNMQEPQVVVLKPNGCPPEVIHLSPHTTSNSVLVPFVNKALLIPRTDMELLALQPLELEIDFHYDVDCLELVQHDDGFVQVKQACSGDPTFIETLLRGGDVITHVNGICVSHVHDIVPGLWTVLRLNKPAVRCFQDGNVLQESGWKDFETEEEECLHCRKEFATFVCDECGYCLCDECVRVLEVKQALLPSRVLEEFDVCENQALTLSLDDVGKPVLVFSPSLFEWELGSVQAYDEGTGEHLLVFADRQELVDDLAMRNFRVLKEKQKKTDDVPLISSSEPAAAAAAKEEEKENSTQQMEEKIELTQEEMSLLNDILKETQPPLGQKEEVLEEHRV